MNDHKSPTLYTLRDNPTYGIVAGYRHNEQLLIMFRPTDYLTILFGEDGKLASVEKKSYSDSDDPSRQQQAILAAIDRTAPIRVQKFFLPDIFVGIKEYPSELEEVLSEINTYTPDEQAYYREELASWARTKQFVLHWDKEYYLNEAGRVVSS